MMTGKNKKRDADLSPIVRCPRPLLPMFEKMRKYRYNDNKTYKERSVMTQPNANRVLTPEQQEQLLKTLQARFEKHRDRHPDMEWSEVLERLQAKPDKLWSLYEMERTEGEPDVIGKDPETGEVVFCDCSAESPKGRRSVCYDPEALEARKQHKPHHSAVGIAEEMGIELLTEEQYHELQRKAGPFDQKTSSWLLTPSDIRKKGGAIFGDFRFGRVFIYHNGADSYYGARGFRGLLRV
jgi:hypothetical protein